jgi:hypothetical protein
MRTAQITIPMRPELRPGYPVWVEHLDCFFYAKSLSHSFAPGSSAQTTITGIAKRAKWLPPGLPDRSEGPGSQNLPSLDDMRLDAPGDYPPMPLYVFPEDIEGSEGGASGPPRVMGFPNVVMALDPEKINPLMMPGGLYFTNGQTYFDTALTMGALRTDPGNPGQYRLAVDDNPSNDISVSENEVIQKFDDYATAMQDATTAQQRTTARAAIDTSTEFGRLVAAVTSKTESAIPDAQQLNNYMGLQRNLKNVFAGADSPGEYRYFSSSAPQPEDQSPSSVTINAEMAEVSKEVPGGPVDSAMTGLTLLYQKGDRIGVKGGMPTRGFRVYGFNPPSEQDAEGSALGHVDVTTREIRFITFQKITQRVATTTQAVGGSGRATLFLGQGAMQELFSQILIADAGKGQATDSTEDRFGTDTAQKDKGYGLIWNACNKLAQDLGVKSNPKWGSEDGPAVGSPVTPPGDLADFANAFEAFSSSRTTVVPETTSWIWVYSDPGPTQGQPSVTGPWTSPVGPTSDRDDWDNWVHSVEVTVPGDRSTSRTKIPKDLSKPVMRATRRDPGLTGEADPQGVASLSAQASQSLAVFLDNIQDIWKDSWPTPDAEATPPVTSDPTEAEETAFATFIETVTEDYDFEVNNSNGRTTVLTNNYTDTGTHTTVLPVSDNRGYEVYGTMAYGRGMNLQSYKKLLEVGGSPTNTASMLAVERFFAAVIATPGADVTAALASMSAEAKADLAVALEAETDELGGIITALKAEGLSPSIYVRNTPVTTSARGQSFTMAISASELASLTTSDTTICLCKGTENSYWIQAFTGEFVELHGDEAVNEFLVTEAEEAGYDYTITKQALSGEMMDLSSGNKLAETIQGAKNAVKSLENTVATAGEEISEEWQEAVDNVRRDAQSVGELIDQAREAETLAEFNENAETRSESQGTQEQEREREDEAEEQLTQTTGTPLDFFTLVGPAEDQGDDT